MLPRCRSIARTWSLSSLAKNVNAFPCFLDRPVLPIRWVYASGVFGTSKFTTWLTSATSIPRAAMSVATSTS